MHFLVSYLYAHVLIFAPILGVLLLLAINAVPAVRDRHLPIISFISRYWLLLAFCVVAVSGVLNETVFQHFGTLIYIVGVSALAAVTMLLIRHVVFRKTWDRYIANNDFTREWEGLVPWQRQLLCLGYFAATLLAVAIVAGLVSK